MPFVTVRPIWVGVCTAARTVFVSEEINVALFILSLLELAVDAVLAILNVTARCEYAVYILL